MASLAAQEGGKAQIGNLFSVIQLIRANSLAGGTLAQAVDEVAHALEDENGENMSRTPLLAEENKVRIMNLHKAKGLEGRFVFLTEPACGKAGGHAPDIHIRREKGAAQGYLPLQEDNGPYHKHDLAAPPDWAVLCALEKRYQQGEECRLLYVAATRAKDFLVVSEYAGKTKGAGMPWAPFLPHLLSVPALKIPSGSAPKKDKTGKKLLTVSDLHAETARRQAATTAAAQASYAITSVTDIAHGKTPRPAAAGDDSGGPGGMDWGTFIHSLLEGLFHETGSPAEKELKARIAAAIPPGSPFAGYEAEALELVNNVLTSQVWAAMRDSPERHAEVPFQAISDPKTGTILSGAIDLVYRVEGGWRVVDYKTDRVGKDAGPWVELYAPQLKLYEEYWERVTGERVVRCGVLFVRTGTAEWI